MKLKKESSKRLALYSLISIVSIIFLFSLILGFSGGTVTEYDYSVTVTPIDSMDNINTNEVVDYSNLNDYEKQLIQTALDKNGADSESEYYETQKNQKEVKTHNRVVNINGVVAHVNIDEVPQEAPDKTKKYSYGLFATGFILLMTGMAALSDREPY